MPHASRTSTPPTNEIFRLGDVQPSTAIEILTSSGPIALSVLDVIKWVAPQAPEPEAMKFLVTCRSLGVNPLTKEAHLIEMGAGKWETVVDKSGWLKKAEEHPAYAGHEAGIIVQDILQPASAGKPQVRGPVKDVVGSFLPPGHVVVGGWAKVWRRDRLHPTEERVSVQEYFRETRSWKTGTCTMVRKVALVQALRESGVVNRGWYDPAELVGEQADIISVPHVPIPARPSHALHEPRNVLALELDQAAQVGGEPDRQHTIGNPAAVEYQAIPDAILSPWLAARLQDLIREVGMTDDQVRGMCERRGVESIVEFTDPTAKDIIGKLEMQLAMKEMGEQLLPDGPTDPATEAPPEVPDVPRRA
jgi:phage recombination protein Bet